MSFSFSNAKLVKQKEIVLKATTAADQWAWVETYRSRKIDSDKVAVKLTVGVTADLHLAALSYFNKGYLFPALSLMKKYPDVSTWLNAVSAQVKTFYVSCNSTYYVCDVYGTLSAGVWSSCGIDFYRITGYFSKSDGCSGTVSDTAGESVADGFLKTAKKRGRSSMRMRCDLANQLILERGMQDEARYYAFFDSAMLALSDSKNRLLATVR